MEATTRQKNLHPDQDHHQDHEVHLLDLKLQKQPELLVKVVAEAAADLKIIAVAEVKVEVVSYDSSALFKNFTYEKLFSGDASD